MYYPDLSRYSYMAGSREMLNVGWLSGKEVFPQGFIERSVRDQLVRLARDPVNVARGFHYCEFCDAESPIQASVLGEVTWPAFLGSGEIHVAADGVVFSAPTLIVHYIDSHSYLPPLEFREAVVRTIDP